MAYSLQDFCRDTRNVLKAGNDRATVEKLTPLMERLAADKEFVAQYFGAQQPEGLQRSTSSPTRASRS